MAPSHPHPAEEQREEASTTWDVTGPGLEASSLTSTLISLARIKDVLEEERSAFSEDLSRLRLIPLFWISALHLSSIIKSLGSACHRWDPLPGALVARNEQSPW